MGVEGVDLAVFLAYLGSLISPIKSSGGSELLRGFPALTLFSKLRDQKYWFDTIVLVLTGHTY